MRRIGLLLALVVVLHSCKKKETIATTPPPEVEGTATAVLVNNIADSVTISFSGLDINTGTIPHIFQRVLPPSDTVIIARTDLKNAYRYRYDWHTRDYTYSSWLATDSAGYHRNLTFEYFGESQDYILVVDGKQRNEQLVCLDGDGLSTTWEAVDALDGTGASVWAGLPERARSHSFVINRFHTVQHSFLDTADKPAATNLAFALDMSAPRMWLKVTQKADSYVLCNDLSPHLALNTTARDTLYFLRYATDSTGIVYPQPWYVLKRKSVER